MRGNTHCRVSILINADVPCQYLCNFDINFKVLPCRSLVNALCHVGYFFPLLLDIMTHVDLKKDTCRRVESSDQDSILASSIIMNNQ